MRCRATIGESFRLIDGPPSAIGTAVRAVDVTPAAIDDMCRPLVRRSTHIPVFYSPMRMTATTLGCASGAVMWALAMICSGAGHGSYLPVAVFGAPLSFIPGISLVSPLVVWPLVGVAVDRRRRLTMLAVAILHACGVGAAIGLGTPFESSDEQWSYLAHVAQSDGTTIGIAVAVYAATVAMMIYRAMHGTRWQGR